MPDRVFDVNPYENNPRLTKTEAEVLWEYAKLNQRLKIVSVSDLLIFRVSPLNPFFHQMITETKRLSQLPEEHLLKDLRDVETKIGFVLTLVRPSPVYASPRLSTRVRA